MASRPQSPRMGLRSPPLPEAPKESVVSRLLLTPLTFVTFLISLRLVDNWNHTHRTNLRSQPPTTVYGKVKQFLHGFVFKPISPYTNVKTTDKQGSGNSKEKEEPWHWHTKQRKMMKAEVSDAFRLRGTVLVILVALMIAAMVGVAMVVRFAYALWRNWGFVDISWRTAIGKGRWWNWYDPVPVEL